MTRYLGIIVQLGLPYVTAMMVFLLGEILPRHSFLARHRFILMIASIFFVTHVHQRMRRNRTRLSGVHTPDAGLLPRLADLSSRFGLRLRGVHIVGGADPDRGKMVTRYKGDGMLLVGCKMLEKLSPAELDFAVARELVHHTRHHRAKATAVTIAGSLLVLVPGALFVSKPANWSALNCEIWAVLAGAVILALDCLWLDRRRDETADRIAFCETRDADAAAQAMVKTMGLPEDLLQLVTGDFDIFSALMVRTRLRKLKKVAEEMRLHVDSAFDKTEQDAALTKRATIIAERMGVKLGEVEVLDLAKRKPLVNAGALCGGKIIVGRALLDTFSPRELDFVLAHEFAHLKSRHPARSLVALGIGVMMLTTSFVFFSLVEQILSGEFSPLLLYLFPTMLVGAVVLVGNFTWMSRSRELQADRMALRATRDLPAAISVIHKVTAAGPEIPENLEVYMTHPKETYRVQSLRREAKRLGIDESVEEIPS